VAIALTGSDMQRTVMPFDDFSAYPKADWGHSFSTNYQVDTPPFNFIEM
jgi:hypothetical protein